MSAGYHFTKFDAILALSGRKMTQRRSAYTYTQTINRNSLVLEGYKFLFDYHGFVPFVGGGIGYEVIELQAISQTCTQKHQFIWSLGGTFVQVSTTQTNSQFNMMSKHGVSNIWSLILSICTLSSAQKTSEGTAAQ